MFITTIKVDQSADWIKGRIIDLNKSSDASLKALRPYAPYYVVIRRKNFLTSPCTGLVYIPAPQPQGQIVRIFFLPNIIYIAVLFCVSMAVYFSIRSYQHGLLAHEHALRVPSLSLQYPAPSFPWLHHLPGLIFLIFFGILVYI